MQKGAARVSAEAVTYDDRGSCGSDTESKAGSEPDMDPSKGPRVAPTVEGGTGENVDHGGGGPGPAAGGAEG
jgi:hypothetical protein